MTQKLRSPRGTRSSCGVVHAQNRPVHVLHSKARQAGSPSAETLTKQSSRALRGRKGSTHAAMQSIPRASPGAASVAFSQESVFSHGWHPFFKMLLKPSTQDASTQTCFRSCTDTSRSSAPSSLRDTVPFPTCLHIPLWHCPEPPLRIWARGALLATQVELRAMLSASQHQAMRASHYLPHFIKSKMCGCGAIWILAGVHRFPHDSIMNTSWLTATSRRH